MARRYQDLENYERRSGLAGRSRLMIWSWTVTSLLIFENGWVPFYGLKRAILRLFGCRVGDGVVIKPHVRIKFPWKLGIGRHSWIGEGAWIDNLAPVEIGQNVCISQDVYLCTGSHDPRNANFALVTVPIRVNDQAWLAARSTVLPGVEIGEGALVMAGAVVTADVPSGRMMGGVPATDIGPRHPASMSA